MMSKKLESNGHITDWESIINSVNRKEAERDNNAKAKIIEDDYRMYDSGAEMDIQQVEHHLMMESMEELDKGFNELFK